MEKLQRLMDKSKRIVFFGGAGVSTESGVPDFRSADGLYNQKYAYAPEIILSHSFFVHNPAEFYRFYRDKLIISGVRPNPAHYALAKLEALGKLSAVITQNIDGLHTDAGSKKVFELHGSVRRNFCMRCGKFYDEKYIAGSADIPYCECGGIIKPDVVLYEEPLNEQVLDGAIAALAAADLLIVAGTSLAVYPAAGLIQYFSGDSLVVINKTETPADRRADLALHEPVGRVLGGLSI